MSGDSWIDGVLYSRLLISLHEIGILGWWCRKRAFHISLE
jgi:hypothetical protein